MNEKIIDFSLVKRANEEQTLMCTLRDTSEKIHQNPKITL